MAVKLATPSKWFKSFNLIDSKQVEIVQYTLIKAFLFYGFGNLNLLKSDVGSMQGVGCVYVSFGLLTEKHVSISLLY